MTGWSAYGILAFHLYPWNQLKVIPVACILRARNDIRGHRRLFRLALQTTCRKVIRMAAPTT